MVGVGAPDDPFQRSEGARDIFVFTQKRDPFFLPAVPLAAKMRAAIFLPPSLREVAAEGRRKEFGCYFWRSENAMFSVKTRTKKSILL